MSTGSSLPHHRHPSGHPETRERDALGPRKSAVRISCWLHSLLSRVGAVCSAVGGLAGAAAVVDEGVRAVGAPAIDCPIVAVFGERQLIVAGAVCGDSLIL